MKSAEIGHGQSSAYMIKVGGYSSVKRKISLIIRSEITPGQQ